MSSRGAETTADKVHESESTLDTLRHLLKELFADFRTANVVNTDICVYETITYKKSPQMCCGLFVFRQQNFNANPLNIFAHLQLP